MPPQRPTTAPARMPLRQTTRSTLHPRRPFLPPVTRPPGDVKVAVANGVGEAGLAGARASVLSTAGYVTVAANAAAETAQSQVYYVEGYGEEAQGITVELGGDAAVLRPAPSDPGALVTDATAVEGFHVFVILGTDRVLG